MASFVQVVDLLFVSDKCHRSTPTKHDGRAVLFAVAELLVLYVVALFFGGVI